MKTYLVFTIQAYDDQVNTTLTNYAELHLIDSSKESAIKRAKAIDPDKKNYRCSKVVEYRHDK